MANKLKRQTTIYRYVVKKQDFIFILYNKHFRNAVNNYTYAYGARRTKYELSQVELRAESEHCIKS